MTKIARAQGGAMKKETQHELDIGRWLNDGGRDVERPPRRNDKAKEKRS